MSNLEHPNNTPNTAEQQTAAESAAKAWEVTAEDLHGGGASLSSQEVNELNRKTAELIGGKYEGTEETVVTSGPSAEELADRSYRLKEATAKVTDWYNSNKDNVTIPPEHFWATMGSELALRLYGAKDVTDLQAEQLEVVRGIYEKIINNN